LIGDRINPEILHSILQTLMSATSLDGTSSVALLLTVAVAPTIYLLWFFYNQDRYRHESIRLLTITFILGAIMTLPAIVLEEIAKTLFPRGNNLLEIFLFFLFEVALIEEGLKFIAVRSYAYNSKMFVEPMDGLILGVAAALGFATVENILYVLGYGISTGIVRAITSVPSHALFGAIIGFYLGEAKFKKKPELAWRGLVIAMFLHAVFDTTATVLPSVIGVIALVGFVIVLYYRVVRGEIREAEAESPFRPPGTKQSQLGKEEEDFSNSSDWLILSFARIRQEENVGL
jgi:protease PrsW